MEWCRAATVLLKFHVVGDPERAPHHSRERQTRGAHLTERMPRQFLQTHQEKVVLKTRDEEFDATESAERTSAGDDDLTVILTGARYTWCVV